VSEDVESLNPLCRLVYRKTGLDLQPYKEKYLRRRVAVRLRATGQPDLAGYLAYLQVEDGELENLILCLTIHVSTFFRNPTTFQAIREQVLPALFGRPSPQPLSFWSVGCARGEEPYSLAILASEYMGEAPDRRELRIEAIDVDASVLEEAKEGRFVESQLKDLDPALARKYFTRNGSFRLVPRIRGMVRFHRRDILMEPTGDGYDFILCRNLLIYIEREPQEVILEGFYHALRPGGYLVLGRTEALVGSARRFFEIVDARERIYRRIGGREEIPSEPLPLDTGRTV